MLYNLFPSTIRYGINRLFFLITFKRDFWVSVKNFKMKPQADKVVKTIAEVNCPLPLSARLLLSQEKDFFAVESTWKYMDLSSIKYVLSGTHHVYQWNEKDVKVISTSSHNLNSVCLSTSSESGDIKVVLRKDKDKTDKEPSPFIDVYKDSRCIHSYDMSEIKLHGDIYLSGEFTTFELSKDGKKLLYVAEKKVPKAESYLKKSLPIKDDKKDSEDLPVKGEEFAYRQDWGERHVKMVHSVLCVMDLASGDVTVLPEVQEAEVTVGGAIWTGDSSSVAFIGYYEHPYRLGISVCPIRRNAIFLYELGSEKPISLTTGTDEFSVYSLRFSPDGKFLVYLQTSYGGPHIQGKQLMKMDWASKESTIIVDLVHACKSNEFPGIYTDCLPRRCFSNDGKYVFLDSFWRSKMVVLCVNLTNKTVQQLNVGDAYGASVVLDVLDNQIIVHASSPSIQPHLIIGKLNVNGDVVSAKWNTLTPTIELDDVKWELITLHPCKDNETYPGLDYEVVLISPKEVQKTVPLLIFPHGGPHCTSAPLYAYTVATFVKMGFAVCKVNYRGSVGFGENNLFSLPGNVGTQDVQDMHFSAEFIRKKLSSQENGITTEVNDVFVYGGSHGGFLAGHLIGQYPDYYRAAVLLNPVIDLTAMLAATDIPDWIWIEGGIKKKFEFEVLDESVLTKLYKMSPMYYLNNVKSPTLLLIGLKDLRVPPSQGINYYRSLKARNVPVRMYVYEDNHSLMATASIHSDVFMQTILFLMEHCTNQEPITKEL